MTFRPIHTYTYCLLILACPTVLQAQAIPSSGINRLPPVEDGFARQPHDDFGLRRVSHEEAPAAVAEGLHTDAAPALPSQPFHGPIVPDPSFTYSNVEQVAPYVLGTPRHCGLFFQYDYLFWTVNSPDTTTIGDRASEGLVTVNDITFLRRNSLDTSRLNNHQDGANRFEFGHTDGSAGWMASILFGKNASSAIATGVNFIPADPEGLLTGYEDANEDGIDDDRNGNNIYGRHGIDLGIPTNLFVSFPSGYQPPPDGIPDEFAPTDFGDQVSHLVSFSEFAAKQRTELAGAEIMRTVRKSPNFQWLYGIRYLAYSDFFSISGQSEVLGATNMAVFSDNRIVGGQIGGRWNGAWSKFVFNVEGRFLLAYNSQTTSQNGFIGQGLTAGPGEPVALAETAFDNTLKNDEFVPLGEFRIEAIAPINRFMAFRAGYTGIGMGGISFASPKIQYQLPQFGLNDVANSEGVYISAFTLGLEINR